MFPYHSFYITPRDGSGAVLAKVVKRGNGFEAHYYYGEYNAKAHSWEEKDEYPIMFEAPMDYFSARSGEPTDESGPLPRDLISDNLEQAIYLALCQRGDFVSANEVATEILGNGRITPTTATLRAMKAKGLVEQNGRYHEFRAIEGV